MYINNLLFKELKLGILFVKINNKIKRFRFHGKIQVLINYKNITSWYTFPSDLSILTILLYELG